MATEQLDLELMQYPRPIAWTISEINRAEGHRDRRDMLLAAYEEVIRYLVLIETARYTEYWASKRGDSSVDAALLNLRRPSLGHYVQALRELDQFLTEESDHCAIDIMAKRHAPMMCKLVGETDKEPRRVRRVSLFQVLSRVTHLRNREKGHGYTGQLDAKSSIALLQPAFIEMLEQIPLLLAQPLVWVERIELVEEDNLVVTLLQLMGTQRAQRSTRQVTKAGNLKKGFLYMWDGESPPLRLTPFLHLERSHDDERVFVLSGIQGEPIYHSRGTADTARQADHLISEFKARAPFLLAASDAATQSRVPDAPRFYKGAVEVALADGSISEAEATRLDQLRHDLGVTKDEAHAIHAELGWREHTAAPHPGPESEPDPEGDPGTPLRDFLQRVAQQVRGRSKSDKPLDTTVADQIDIRVGELWIQVGPTQGTSAWFVGKRLDRVKLAVGFYSRNQRRDPQYRAARRALVSDPVAPPAGWRTFTHETRAQEGLALETRKGFLQVDLSADAVVDEVAELLALLTDRVRAELAAPARSGDVVPTARVSDGNADSQEEPVVESSAVPGAFPLPPVVGSPRLQGSVWLARILWALEHARCAGLEPITAADIARILCDSGVQVPGTNTARALRTPKDDPRRTGLCTELDGQRYAITAKGRRLLYESLPGQQETSAA